MSKRKLPPPRRMGTRIKRIRFDREDGEIPFVLEITQSGFISIHLFRKHKNKKHITIKELYAILQGLGIQLEIENSK